jgi:hypothetical protein
MIGPTLWPVCELLGIHQVVYKVMVLNFFSPENDLEPRWHPQIQNGDITLHTTIHISIVSL